MKSISFITPPDARCGFALAGATQYVIEPAELRKTLSNVFALQQSGLIIVDERLTEVLDDDELKNLDRRFGGILLILPAPVRGSGPVEDYAARLIRRAIGYQLKIRF